MRHPLLNVMSIVLLPTMYISICCCQHRPLLSSTFPLIPTCIFCSFSSSSHGSQAPHLYIHAHFTMSCSLFSYLLVIYCQQPPCSSLLHTLCHMHECTQLCLMNYGHYSFGLLRLAPSCSASACRCTVMLYTVCSMYAECGWPKRKFMLIPSYANMLS